MNLLVDTNIILEVLLSREKAGEAQALLAQTERHDFYLSDFFLHSIGVYLCKRKLHSSFIRFLNDMVFSGVLMIMPLPVDQTPEAITAAIQFNLDFDDAYQYATGKNYGLTLLSYDHDFDRTDRGRKTPKEILAQA